MLRIVTRLLAGAMPALLPVFLMAPAAQAQTPAPVQSTAPAQTPAPVVTAAPPADMPPPSAGTPARPRNRFRIGPEIGLFLPTSSKTRDQFGSSSVSLGLGIGSISRVSPRGMVAFDLQLLYQTKNGNHLFLAPVGVGYRKALSVSGANTVYAGLTADVYLADLRSADYNVHSGIRTGFGGSPLVGVDFGDSGFVEARYFLVSRIKGFDLSGLSLSAGYRF